MTHSLPPASNPDILSDTYPDLWTHVEQERIALYEGLGWDADAATTYEPFCDNTEFLLGNCHMNATELASRLNECGYDPVLVLGALSYDDSPPTIPDEPGGSVRTSNFHAWVELPEYTDSRLVVDVATERNDAPGLPYISQKRPSEYIVPSRSRFEYEPWMTHEIVGVETLLEDFRDRATLAS